MFSMKTGISMLISDSKYFIRMMGYKYAMSPSHCLRTLPCMTTINTQEPSQHKRVNTSINSLQTTRLRTPVSRLLGYRVQPQQSLMGAVDHT